MANTTVASRAGQIIKKLSDSLSNAYPGTNSMTPSVYDTAWVAMVSKNEEQPGKQTIRWQFPECFEFVLNSQSGNGGFGHHYTEVDGILNTMAAILALCKLRNNPDITGVNWAESDVSQRIHKGILYLDQKLKSWDVKLAVHVGFEILVPSMLSMLQEEGFEFDFSGSRELKVMNQRKLAKIPLKMLYLSTKTTLLHSMEAFVGRLDFNKVQHHIFNGSMMASPSSTAAYLMNIDQSHWDDTAETYLRAVVNSGNGSVPSAFPISTFEFTWVLSTLLQSGFTCESLGTDDVSQLADSLEAQLLVNGGGTGFAPGMLPDADDTAKTLLVLSKLGRLADCDILVSKFETSTHFKTYDFESSESFSANCNVLNALIHSKNPENYLPQISKALKFLCKMWHDGKAGDKWNLDPQYSIMLLSEVLEHIVKLWDNGPLADLSTDLMPGQVPLVSLQMLVRTLSAQSSNGSWKDSPESTAYALLTLKKLGGLPWLAQILSDEIKSSISVATKYLEAEESRWDEPAFIWIEKITYGSKILSEAYCLAALQAPSMSSHSWGPRVMNLLKAPADELEKFSKFFKTLPVLSSEPEWRLRASIVEGYMLAPLLRDRKPDIFPSAEGSKYLEYIPFSWTTINNANGFAISTQVIMEMMIVSVLNFQADKYIEQVAENSRLDGNFEALHATISNVFEQHEKNPQAGHFRINGKSGNVKFTNGTSTNGDSTAALPTDKTRPGTSEQYHRNSNGIKRNFNYYSSEIFHAVTDTLAPFVSYVLTHPKISNSPSALRRRVAGELSGYLHSQVEQGQLSSRIPRPISSSNKLHVFVPEEGTYYDWVRTTSADSTSCPYSFEFYRCLISPSGGDCFSGTMSRYVCQDLCRHLATMCRQYNDYGSVTRDHEESNLNSVNFSDFHPDDQQQDSSQLSLKALKETLLGIANYERQGLNLAMDKLKPEISTAAWKALRVFVDVTDLYGQIYVVRDINNGKRK